MTACGGNLIGGEISRNKQCPLCGLAPIEAAESRKGEGFPLAYHSAIAEWQQKKRSLILGFVFRGAIRIRTGE